MVKKETKKWYKIYDVSGKYWKKLKLTEKDARKIKRVAPKIVKSESKKKKRRSSTGRFGYSFF